MIKLITFSAVTVLLAGCSGLQKSEVWNRVVNAPRTTSGKGDRSSNYAGGLHSELMKAQVPHKVVTYRYPFSSKLYGHGTAERTSVIYRDDRSASNPWWLMDEQLSRPLWLPNLTVERQVNFFLRRPATVVSLREYMTGDSKAVVPIQAQKCAHEENRLTAVQRMWQRVMSYLRMEKTSASIKQNDAHIHVALEAPKRTVYRVAVSGLRSY